jgi:hypothetical protein
MNLGRSNKIFKECKNKIEGVLYLITNKYSKDYKKRKDKSFSNSSLNLKSNNQKVVKAMIKKNKKV